MTSFPVIMCYKYRSRLWVLTADDSEDIAMIYTRSGKQEYSATLFTELEYLSYTYIQPYNHQHDGHHQN